jgi:hypothetical protein
MPGRPTRILLVAKAVLEKSIGVDTFPFERGTVHVGPHAGELGRHLGVKLDAEASADGEGLRSSRTIGDHPSAERRRKRVEVPL